MTYKIYDSEINLRYSLNGTKIVCLTLDTNGYTIEQIKTILDVSSVNNHNNMSRYNSTLIRGGTPI